MIDPTGDVITPSMGSYSKDESDAKYVAKTQIVQTEGTSTTNVMSQKAVTDELTALETDLNLKINKTSVKQVTGTSETDVMSQKAVTDELAKKQDTNLLASYTHSGNKEVYIENTNVEDNDIVFLFPYNHEKLKQLIKILS